MLRELLDYEHHFGVSASGVRPAGHFTTATGREVFLLDPQRCDIDIIDIAVSLSRQCRFAGHLRLDVDHYSVAQHSTLVSFFVPEELALVGLLHDATEAYLQDIVGPLKSLLGQAYADLEHAWALAIGAAFGLGDTLANLPHEVQVADRVLLATEKRDLRKPTGRRSDVEPLATTIVPLSAQASREAFLRRFKVLTQI